MRRLLPPSSDKKLLTPDSPLNTHPHLQLLRSKPLNLIDINRNLSMQTPSIGTSELLQTRGSPVRTRKLYEIHYECPQVHNWPILNTSRCRKVYHLKVAPVFLQLT